MARARRRRGTMEQACRRTQEAHHEISLESGSGALLRLQLHDEANVGLQVCEYVLSTMGWVGYPGAGQSGPQQSEDVRAAGRPSDEYCRERGAMGSALWLGEYRDALHRRAAALRGQRRCRPSLVRLSVERRREFPPG